jgi:hypothetical protein
MKLERFLEDALRKRKAELLRMADSLPPEHATALRAEAAGLDEEIAILPQMNLGDMPLDVDGP